MNVTEPAADGRRRPRRRGSRDGRSATTADALLVTKLVNVRWLTGFTGSAGVALRPGRRIVLVTDGRYETQAAEQVAAAGVGDAVEIAIGRTVPEQTDAAARRHQRPRRARPRGPRRHVGRPAPLRRRALAPELVPSDGLVDRLRVVKDDGEIARIEAAAAIATDGPRPTSATGCWDGPTEAEFGLELDTEMRRLGASGPSFETIVASGPNGGQAPPPAVGPRASPRATSSSSTSAPRSTATAPT